MTDQPASKGQSIDLESSDGQIPIRCFADEQLLPDEAARRALKDLASHPDLDKHVTVLPDVHYKDRNPAPSGTVVVSKGHVVPRAIDGGVNCGMRSMVTNVMAKDLTPEILDELFGRLVETVPLKAHEEPLLTEQECEELLVHGLEKLIEPLGLPQDELDRTENRGRMDLGIDPETIRENLPRKPLVKYRGSIGALGAGNHFLELQEVVEICDEEAAERMGLKLGAAMFMMHTDSRKLGKKIISGVQDEAEAAFRTEETGDLFGIPVDSDIGKRYLACLTATMHAGFANRAAITNIVRKTMGEVLGDPDFKLSLVCDSGHETIQPEEHDGETVWVHRHGASHPQPPSDKVADPKLADLGQPVPLAGCLGMDSYICLAGPDVADTFHSGPHGAGRVLSKIDSANTFDPDEVEEDIRSRGVRLYRYHSDNIAGQSPLGFKDVKHVVGTMNDMGVLRPVVRLRPLAALKG